MSLTKEQYIFIERFSASTFDAGAPPSMGKILAYLLVCQPAAQSAEDLQRALQLSAGSVSSALNLLLRPGIVERRTLAGERRYYYEFNNEAMDVMVRRKLEAVSRARKIITEAKHLPQADERLASVERVYRLFEERLGDVLNEVTTDS